MYMTLAFGDHKGLDAWRRTHKSVMPPLGSQWTSIQERHNGKFLLCLLLYRMPASNGSGCTG